MFGLRLDGFVYGQVCLGMAWDRLGAAIESVGNWPGIVQESLRTGLCMSLLFFGMLLM